jgi:hypothetical protein
MDIETTHFVMLADDIVLSTWAKKQGVKLYKIIQDRLIVKHEPKNTSELNLINDSGGNNEKVYDYFEEIFDIERFDKLVSLSKNNSFNIFLNKNQ